MNNFEDFEIGYNSLDIDQLKLFDYKQILLFIGAVSMHDDDKVKKIIYELGFNENVLIFGNYAMPTRNLYAGFFSFKDGESNMYNLKEHLHKIFEKNNIGMVDFFLIDATETSKLKSIWHDGFY